MKIFRNLIITLGFVFSLFQLIYAQNPPIDVSIPDISGEENATVTIPIQVGDMTGRNVISYQAVISFDENILDATGASSTGTLTEPFGAPILNTSVADTITIAGFGTSPLEGNGVLVNLIFDVVGQPGEMTNLNFSDFIFNSGDPPASTQGGVFVVNAPVPVELISFSAEVRENSVMLDWVTASETNNFGFEIEKSEDGNAFSKIGFEAGRGTTTTPQTYIFHDRNIQAGTFFYRLKQIDTDGSFELSNSLEVEISLPRNFILEQNYPNPFNPETFIEFRIENTTRVILKIFNLFGEEVKRILDEPRTAGLHRVKWNGLNNQDKIVSAGVYIYELKAGNFKKSRKMLLLK